MRRLLESSNQKNTSLIKPISGFVLNKALLRIGDFSSLLFQCYISKVGPEIITYYIVIFNDSYLLGTFDKEINVTEVYLLISVFDR